MESLRPNQQRARNAMLSLWLWVGLLSLSIFVNFWTLSKMKTLPPEEAVKQTAGFQYFIGFLMPLFLIAVIVFFLLWFRRAYANLHRLETVEVEHADAWAIWSWFIPIFNFFRPYNIMKEIWVKTQEAYKGEGKDDSRWIVDLWWVFFLLSLLFVYQAFTSKTPLAEVSMLLLSGAVLLVGALLAIEMLSRTRRYEEALYQSQQNYDPTQHLVAASKR